jgi:hypothetical protein
MSRGLAKEESPSLDITSRPGLDGWPKAHAVDFCQEREDRPCLVMEAIDCRRKLPGPLYRYTLRWDWLLPTDHLNIQAI